MGKTKKYGIQDTKVACDAIEYRIRGGSGNNNKKGIQGSAGDNHKYGIQGSAKKSISYGLQRPSSDFSLGNVGRGEPAE